MDKKIEEIANQDKYCDSVHALCCFKGIKTITALAICVEICDFHRFPKAKNFTAFLGLVPGEESSSTGQNLGAITKQGNTFLRKLLVEAAQSYSRTTSGKSKALQQRQEGSSTAQIAYADKANERMRKRYYKLVIGNKKNHNTATTAVARELACFIWGMMTNHIQITAAA